MKGRTGLDGVGDRVDEGWAGLLQNAAALLGRHGRLAVSGPWGAGKSVLLKALADLPTSGRRCVRIRTQEADRDLPWAALTQLLEPMEHGQLPPSWPTVAPAPGPPAPYAPREPVPVRHGAARPSPRMTPVLGRPLAVLMESGMDRLKLRVAVTALLRGGGPVLLLVDGAQWLDEPSADVLGYALRTLPEDVLAVVATERTAGHPTAASALLGGHPPVLAVPPADLTETAALLGSVGLPARWASPVRRYCGGHRGLLDVCCRALAAAERTHDGHSRPLWPPQVRELAASWLLGVPVEVRDTLRVAALARHPDADLLRQAGRTAAEEHLAEAARAGLLTTGEVAGPGAVVPPRARFAAEALAEAAAATGTSAQRLKIHRALAEAEPDPVQRARHRGLAQESTHQAVAEDTARAAAAARESGERALAAELMLLSARLTPAGLSGPRLDRLAAAAADAAAAGCTELARDAAARIAVGRGSPAQQLHALMAVADAHGQDLTAAEPLFASARRLAGTDPALLAAVELREAVQANIRGGAAIHALHHAEAATELARQGGDVALEAASLTMRARMERVLGHLDRAPVTLARALALAVPPLRLGIRNSPEYLFARHAVFDGRLTEARQSLLALLPAAQAAGEAEDLVEVWRSLAEVDAWLGSCQRALEWSARAVELTEAAGLSPGPAWYTAALAHSCGGSFARALRHAEQGVRASREEHDALYTSRGLWMLGAVRLHIGETEGAAAALAEVAELESLAGSVDPGMLRWQADTVEAFAASGRHERARALLDAMQDTVGSHPGHAGLRAALTRARAVCVDAEGRPEEAAELLADAAHGFAGLGLRVEEGRTHLTRGRVERRRRRRASARVSWETALGVFEQAQARPWVALTGEHLARLTSPPSSRSAPARAAAGGTEGVRALTEHEFRLAGLVARGATNREAAQQLFVSVKTVETMLSRIYRKMGIRSRTQLSCALSS
ncbi:LuxR C-terminal-related transcriptional regulator [Streptomyces sp. NPDC058657]|uniref:helix-turn-helix transcriptional regulator n=1 Tax=unclassified Streptomyces TaxID=2593676 RepID=UPI0036600A12